MKLTLGVTGNYFTCTLPQPSLAYSNNVNQPSSCAKCFNESKYPNMKTNTRDSERKQRFSPLVTIRRGCRLLDTFPRHTICICRRPENTD